MGLQDWLKRKIGVKIETGSEKGSDLKKTLTNRTKKLERSDQQMMYSELGMPEAEVISPAVEHPLLTIQDRISRMEELYKGLHEKLGSIDTKVATRDDVDDLKALINEDIVKEDKILLGIGGINDQIVALETRKQALTHTLNASTGQLTQELTRVDQELKLLEADKAILESLKDAPNSSIGLAEELKLTRQYIWGRLKILLKHNKVKKTKEGRKTIYELV